MQQVMQWLSTTIGLLAARLDSARGRGEEGSSTLETVIIAAVLSAAAITATGVIVAAIVNHSGAIK